VKFLTAPREIERESFKIIDGLIGERLAALDGPVKEIVRRVVHATGDPAVAAAVEVHPGAVEAAFEVFGGSRDVVADVHMVVAGITRLTKRYGLTVHCAAGDPEVEGEAARCGCTRAMAAVKKLARFIDGGLAAVGNSPTALWEILEMAHSGTARPALVVGTPVGFVGAAESKRALAESGLPYITLHGTKGGSAVAASIVNSLLILWGREIKKRGKEAL